LIENQWREENKEAFFDLFDQQWLWDNEIQRDKIRKHLSHIHREVKQTYWSDFLDVYLTEMIDKIFPAQAESTHRIRAELQDVFS
jgi:hypothetical protein